jgi:hypothetical protein
MWRSFGMNSPKKSSHPILTGLMNLLVFLKAMLNQR